MCPHHVSALEEEFKHYPIFKLGESLSDIYDLTHPRLIRTPTHYEELPAQLYIEVDFEKLDKSLRRFKKDSTLWSTPLRELSLKQFISVSGVGFLGMRRVLWYLIKYKESTIDINIVR